MVYAEVEIFDYKGHVVRIWWDGECSRFIASVDNIPLCGKQYRRNNLKVSPLARLAKRQIDLKWAKNSCC